MHLEKELTRLTDRKMEVAAYLEFIATCDGCTGDYERHHLLPKSLYPEHRKAVWNIKRLHPEDHFMAHYHLYRVFPNSREMCGAWHIMCLTRDTLSPELLRKYAVEYGEARQRWIELSSQRYTGHGNPNYGKVWIANLTEGLEAMVYETQGLPVGWVRGKLPKSELAKQRLSKTQSGEGNHSFGRRHTFNPETGETALILKTEAVPTGWSLGRPQRPESTRVRMSEAKRGAGNPHFGTFWIWEPATGLRRHLLIGDAIPEGWEQGKGPNKSV